MSEERRPIPGYSHYEASADGRIYRRGSDSPRSAALNNKGYLTLTLRNDDGNKRKVLVHRLVCIAFHGPSIAPRTRAAHSNSNSTDNRSDNIGWKTPKENEEDKLLVGRANRCERNGRAKVTTEQVAAIRSSKETCRVLATTYGLSRGHVGQIRKGVFWP